MSLTWEQLEEFISKALSEKLALKPGEAGWDKYAELVGKAYMAAPDFESRAVPHYQALIPFIEKMFKQIQSRVKVEWVDYHPYKDAQELRDDVKKTGILKIATVDAKHDIFTPEINWKFRAIHDYMAHIQAIGSRGTEFSLRGEIAAYNAHLKTVPSKAIPALFTEVIGQVCTYYYLGGKFASVQKIILLDGFDYINVGEVKGYNVKGKELAAAEEEPMLNEGGNIFGSRTDSIPREYIQPTLDKYYNELKKLFPKHKDVFDTFEPVGSVGKKSMSGDIDLAIDLKQMFTTGEIDIEELKSWNINPEQFQTTFLKYKKRARSRSDEQIAWRAFLTELANYINKASNLIVVDLKKITPGTMFTLFPQIDEVGEDQGIGVQIDWMIGNFDWLTFSYFSDYETKDEPLIKGLHRTQLLLALFIVKNHSFSHTEGVKNKETGKIVATSPRAALKLLSQLYNVPIEHKDTDNFNSLYNWMVASLSNTDRDAVIDSYLKVLDFTKSVKFKDPETGEIADCGYIPKVLEDYWIINKRRLNLSGKYICRQSNEKLWNTMQGPLTEQTAIPISWTKVGRVIYDPNGLGSVPDQTNVDYMGFTVQMTTREFLKLNPERGEESEYLAKHFQTEGDVTIAPAWVSAEYIGDEENPTPNDYWKIDGHEGRGRTIEVEKINPNSLMPVHIFPRKSMRARHLTQEMVLAPIESDRRSSSRLRVQPSTIIWQGEVFKK